jgi:hypothetical protein
MYYFIDLLSSIFYFLFDIFYNNRGDILSTWGSPGLMEIALAPIDWYSYLRGTFSIELDFNNNLFTTEQLAWLAAKLKNVNSRAFSPYYTLKHPIVTSTKSGKRVKDTVIVGKGKPILDSHIQSKRIEKYVAEFNQLVEKYSKE